jgi:hypothetical protein
MATLLQITCLTFLLCISYVWGFPSSIDELFPSSTFDESFPSTIFDDPFDVPFNEDWSSSSIFDTFRKMMAAERQQFKASTDNVEKIKNKLADVTPVCTTSNSTTDQQTTRCIKEVTIDGTKYIGREVKVTDNNGTIISKSNDYRSFMADSNHTMISSITN